MNAGGTANTFSPVTAAELRKRFGSMIASPLRRTKIKPLKVSYMGIRKGACYSKAKVNQSRGAVETPGVCSPGSTVPLHPAAQKQSDIPVSVCWNPVAMARTRRRTRGPVGGSESEKGRCREEKRRFSLGHRPRLIQQGGLNVRRRLAQEGLGLKHFQTQKCRS